MAQMEKAKKAENIPVLSGRLVSVLIESAVLTSTTVLSQYNRLLSYLGYVTIMVILCYAVHSSNKTETNFLLKLYYFPPIFCYVGNSFSNSLSMKSGKIKRPSTRGGKLGNSLLFVENISPILEVCMSAHRSPSRVECL